MFFKKERTRGEILPPFCYGFAYRNVYTVTEVFYLIPINYLVQFGRVIHYKWDMFRSKPTWMDEEIEKVLSVQRNDMAARYRLNMLAGVSDFIKRVQIAVGLDCDMMCSMDKDNLKIRISTVWKDKRIAYEMIIQRVALIFIDGELVVIDRCITRISDSIKHLIKRDREG